jgi:predicted RNA-binding protein with RPS1 domain
MEFEQLAEPEELTAQDIKPKTHFTGRVVATTLAGAIVDIGLDKPGLLHISQMISPAGQPMKRVEDVLQPGQTIDVWVKRVAKRDGNERIELTMIRPLDLEWRNIKKDMVVRGKVVRLEPFGAFVDIGAERPALLHVSEISHKFVQSPQDFLAVGDEVEAMVIDVDRHKKQIKLSMKQVEPEPIAAQPEPRSSASVSQPKPFPRTPVARPAQPKKAPKVAKAKKERRQSTGQEGSLSSLEEGIEEHVNQDEEPSVFAMAFMEALERSRDHSDASTNGGEEKALAHEDQSRSKQIEESESGE